MRSAHLAAVASVTTFASATAIPNSSPRNLVRAEPANGQSGYTPQYNDCPSDLPTVRSADGLSSQESDWLPSRRNATIEPMRDLLNRINITGFDATSYINQHSSNASNLPNIAIAASGGGYRAMLNGAGYLEAFDNRTTNATAKGQLGGLLQSATYLAGLSGGSWLVTSLYDNNFTSIDNILASDTSSTGYLWQLDESIFDGPTYESTGTYWNQLINVVKGKADAGFNTTITDYWGRALSYQLVNASEGGPNYTFSSIADQDWFSSGSVPLPLIVTDNRQPGQTIISSNSTIFQFDPWNFGSFDPTVYAFVDLKYVGTTFNGGKPANSSSCVTGFDNVGFMTGTSSSLFNEALIVVNGSNTTGFWSTALKDILLDILDDIGDDNTDIADYPNPFYGYNNGSNVDYDNERLTLVDGGEDGQNIPLNPVIQPQRNVDVVFAIDSSADTDTSYPTNDSASNWPDGTSMVSTYERSLTTIANGTAFPAVPDTNTFINLGLNNRPTFFGCNASNTSSPTPLIVYLPNAPYTYDSNVSTYDLKYTDSQRNAIILNAYNGATQGNGSLDSEWDVCVGCAILSRSFDRTGTTVPSACQTCFNRYCWNGTTNYTAPGAYQPSLKLADHASNTTTEESAAGRQTASAGAALLVSVLTAWALL